eukprot:2159077-Amphidinium_carterae.1
MDLECQIYRTTKHACNKLNSTRSRNVLLLRTVYIGQVEHLINGHIVLPNTMIQIYHATTVTAAAKTHQHHDEAGREDILFLAMFAPHGGFGTMCLSRQGCMA